ncbi:FG-GAP-like repeat-containing protein [Catellatospora sp. KI3]|uniref:CHAP domain-containing protein n=1 Tax=Catellatospora sp. KI3 TaxID=3041620 RepID=UPI002483120B|nr:CHAP domain-containing protein [Catellatospora sp. KI3]MDI1462898.1 FG-GAP-like repeat-containing protein [Catellatospora sp. KI3]
MSIALLKRIGTTVVATAAVAFGVVVAPTAAHATVGSGIVTIAQRELNDSLRNVEIGNNCTYYGGQMFGWPACGGRSGWGGGGDDYAWCAAFAKYTWREGGVTSYLSEVTGMARSFKTYGQNHGTWHARSSGYVAQPGDAVVFDWEGDGVIDHVGIVKSVSGTTLYTIEGNTSDSIKAKTYTSYTGNSDIVGFTTPVGAGGGGGSSLASPILGYDAGNYTVMYRWNSNGTSFGSYSTATHAGYDLDGVGDRVASGDVDGDGTDDTVMAMQNPDGTFSFKVLLHGTAAPQTWYTSGPFNLGPVANRLVLADVNGDGKADPILGYDSGTTTILYRWYSTGSSFGSYSTATYAGIDLDNVGNRMAAADVNGDGRDDTVIALQNADTSFTYKVFLSGTTAPVDWYTSGPFSLAPVGDRLILADVNGDSKAEPILGYDGGTYLVLYRWYSNGSSFGNLSTATYYNIDLDNAGSRMAAGDVNGDGMDDTVIAVQNADTSFTYKVFLNGTIAPVDWYTSGPMSLAPVANRLLVGSWL